MTVNVAEKSADEVVRAIAHEMDAVRFSSKSQGQIDALPLLPIEPRFFPRSRPLVQGPIQPALLIALAGQPHCLRGQAHVARHLADGLPVRELPQHVLTNDLTSLAMTPAVKSLNAFP
jgi:hypothetical protein